MTREDIIRSIGQFSVTPRIIRHLACFVDDPGGDIGEAITTIQAEPILATALLAACNAPTHFRGGHVLNITDAVHRLGRRETYRILLLITFRQGLRIANLPDTEIADRLWRRAIVTACAMEVLAMEELGPPAYTIGLLHLVGCFVLARNGFDYAPLFDATSASTLAHIERQALGIDHPEIGAMALERWQLPSAIHGPIRWQLVSAGAGEHVGATTFLARATRIARFIESSRTTPPAVISLTMACADIGLSERRAESNAHKMMERFGLSLPRPRWVSSE